MKTSLQTITDELAVILGENNSEIRYISWPPETLSHAYSNRKSAKITEPETALAMIDAALARLDSGTFGLCTACGGEISLKRLDLDPSVLDCAGCASHAGL